MCRKIINLRYIQNLTFIIIISSTAAQTHLPADPFHLLINEKLQFDDLLPLQSNIFRPVYYDSDSLSFSLSLRNESFFNDNAPNQENMDVRYFSKGFGNFQSIQLSMNSPFLTLMAEPYISNSKFYNVNKINRVDTFAYLNDQPLAQSDLPSNSGFRNLLAFVHYKGFGIGWHSGNRWWGPGIHSAFQMTNNTVPFPAQILGTIKEIRIGRLGFYGLYTFAHINDETGEKAKYFTSLNGQLSFYGPIIISTGFSRNYLTGGMPAGESGYIWTKNDARKIIFEDIFISNLIDKEYTVGGHDMWDQTLSGYLSLTLPKRRLKIYLEIGFNDNRMYFADFLSQPDHGMATIIGIRDYGIGDTNLLWGFEWTNLMITYTSRHRPTGPGTWFINPLYNYSSYYGRRWSAHSGADSDDWFLYAGYLSDNFMFVPSFNYERHGIVSHRPAEVKLEARLDIRYNYNNNWLGIFYEKQYEAFLGFPDYFYVDNQNLPTGYYSDNVKGLANSRNTNTLIVSISRTIEY